MNDLDHPTERSGKAPGAADEKPQLSLGQALRRHREAYIKAGGRLYTAEEIAEELRRDPCAAAIRALKEKP